MLRRIIHWLGWIYAGYVFLALLVLLPALNVLTPRLVAEHTGRVLQSELILFNPFTLALEVRNAALEEAEGGHFASLETLRVDLSTASLWRPGVVLESVIVRGLNVNVHRLDEDTFNFSDLMASDPEPQPAEPSRRPGITVGTIEFGAHEINYKDDTRTPQYESFLRDIGFVVTGLSTVRDDGSPYELQITTQYSGSLRWRGEVSLPTQQSSGVLQISNLDLRPLHRYLASDLGFALDSALLDIGGNYSVTWSAEPAVEINGGQFSLRQVAMVPLDVKSLPDTGIQLARLDIEDIAVDSSATHAGIARVTLEGLIIDGFSEGDRISLLEMLLPDAGLTADPAVPERSSAEPAEAGEAPEWQIDVAEVRTSDSRVSWRSELTSPALITLDPIAIAATNISYPPAGDSGLQVAVTANDVVRFTSGGDLDLGTGNGRLGYTLAGLPLSWFNPLLDPVINARIDDGKLDIDGDISTTGFSPANVALDTRVTDFAFKVSGLSKSALAWSVLNVPEVKLNFNEQTGAVGQVTLKDYRGRLHILPDGRLNAQTAIRGQADPTGDPATPAVPADGGADADAAGSSAWRLQLAGLVLDNAQIDFEDESLPLDFRTLIGSINGEIGALDTGSDASTPVSLEGAVDGYAPVTIKGDMAPLAAERALDITVRFQGMDIANLTPYAGTYAGYAIDSGTLNLDLHYQLQGDRLQGENRAVINQMRLGEQVDSPKAFDVPLKLALALLTDAKGVIDLDVPISGDVNSPNFSLGKVIGRAIGNLITKAVTAPFRLLAGLAGSSEDLQQIDFEPGAGRLPIAGAGKLGTLAEALTRRPQLRLRVNGGFNAELDTEALRAEALNKELLAAGLTETDINARSDGWLAIVEERYASSAPSFSTAEETPRDVTIEDKYAAVVASTDVPESTLNELARARASAVKSYLVTTGGIAADRIAISASGASPNEGDASIAGVTMDLDA